MPPSEQDDSTPPPATLWSEGSDIVIQPQIFGRHSLTTHDNLMVEHITAVLIRIYYFFESKIWFLYKQQQHPLLSHKLPIMAP